MEEEALVKEVSIPLFQSQMWMKLLGVVMIIQGVVSALTVIGILIAWLPIWLGVLLWQAATKAESAQYSGQKMQLVESLSKLKMYFIINGVLMLISLVGVGIAFLAMGGAMLGMMQQW